MDRRPPPRAPRAGQVASVSPAPRGSRPSTRQARAHPALFPRLLHVQPPAPPASTPLPVHPGPCDYLRTQGLCSNTGVAPVPGLAVWKAGIEISWRRGKRWRRKAVARQQRPREEVTSNRLVSWVPNTAFPPASLGQPHRLRK